MHLNAATTVIAFDSQDAVPSTAAGIVNNLTELYS